MTIAVAALWPWDYISSVMDLSTKAPLQQAVILLSDSRWTIKCKDPSKSGGVAENHLDGGKKLFKTASDAGAVYAGHVAAGEECLSRLARRFQKNMVKRPVTRLARDLFRAVYAGHHTKSPLRIFVGSCNQAGQAELWYFDSDKAFEPIRLTGVNLLAFPDTQKMFREGLEAESHIIRPDRLTPLQGFLWLSAALQEHVMWPEVDRSVGGKIQSAVIDSGGFTTNVLLSAPADNAQLSDDAWKKLTPEAGELRTLYPREPRERRPLASTPIELYQIMQ